jgi:hypothetical protein
MYGIAGWLGFPDDVIDTPPLYQRLVMLLALDLSLKNGSQ